MYQQVMKGNI